MELPKRLQSVILAEAPEIDANDDGTVSVEELLSGRDKLPDGMQVALDIFLETQTNSLGNTQTAKRTATKTTAPSRNGSTPFLDPMFEYAETENIQYAKAKSGDTEMPLLLDVYRPVANPDLPKTLPAIIFAFGGGWKKGSKDVKYIRDLCEYYATRGYVAISIQYRIQKDNPPALPGPAPSPETNEQYRLMNAAVQDTANAVRWARAHAAEYGFDPDRIAIGGVSAGAFNALYTGFCGSVISGPNVEVAAVVSLMGALESKYIDEADPPVFIAHGTRDNLVPYAMVENMVDRLDKIKGNYVFYPVEGEAHRLQTILDTKFDGKTVLDHSVDFCFQAMELSELIAKDSD
jgi:acetyl esterase/lipase